MFMPGVLFEVFEPGINFEGNEGGRYKSPVKQGCARYEMWGWLDTKYAKESRIPEVKELTNEAKNRKPKWSSNNAQIEYNQWRWYHEFSGHFKRQ